MSTDRALALKEEQARKKQRVTLAAKRLQQALDRKSDPGALERILDELESCWYEFETVHVDYVELVTDKEELRAFTTVNNLNMSDYKAGVLEVYNQAKSNYFSAQRLLQENNVKLEALKVKSQIKRLERLCNSAKAAFEDPEQDKSHLLAYIRQDIEPLVTETMNLLVATPDLEIHLNVIESVFDTLDELKLSCKLASTRVQAVKTESQQNLKADPSFQIEKHSVSAFQNSFYSQNSAGQSESTVIPSSGDPLDTKGNSPTMQTSNGSHAPRGPRSVPSSEFSHSASSANVSQDASQFAPSSLREFQGSLPPMGPTLTYPYSGCDPFGGPSFPPQHCSVNSWSFTGPGLTSPPVSTTFNPVPHSSSQSNVSGILGPSQNVSAPLGFNDFHLKRSSLPEFSGLRKDWAEFKTVWKELAERSFSNKAALAFELKKSLKGVAKERVKNIYITRPDAYELIWKRLCEFYDDCSASVQSALEDLHKLKIVQENDFKGLVYLIDEVESAHAQLFELGQADVLSIREVDKICELLPGSVRMVWNRVYFQLEDRQKLHPLDTFMKFLQTERASVVRLADVQGKRASHRTGSNFVSSTDSTPVADSEKVTHSSCAVHRQAGVKHKTYDCKAFVKLSLSEKFEALRNAHACFRCFGSHRRDKCRAKVNCTICKKTNHQTLMCKQNSSGVVNPPPSERGSASSANALAGTSHAANTPKSGSLYAIFQAVVDNSGKTATIFCDNGSSSSYITHDAASRHGAKMCGRYTLEVTTMGNVETDYDTCLYELTLKTATGKRVNVVAFGMTEITGPVSVLDVRCLRKLFPDRDPALLQRESSRVDMLLGCDYFGLHPKHEVDSAGPHLSVMQGELGICLQGYHPNLVEGTRVSSNMVRLLHNTRLKTDCLHGRVISHLEFDQPMTGPSVKTDTNTSWNKPDRRILDFVCGEELATEVSPKCGGCKCSKCPTVGHTYSFREQQELQLIRDNLRYDPEEQCWVTKYPWLSDPASLPDNYRTALSTLKSTESTLKKDSEWTIKYSEQIKDMLDRGVACRLSEDDIREWKGPKYYLSHLAVKNPRSQSTPVRIVFNSSQLCRGVSLNSVLAKGPDAYLNNLLGLLLRWREGPVALVGDIKKMFHSVRLDTLEQQCHRFLWRDLETDRMPDEYMMLRVNMGDRPAPAICTEALYMTADKFESDSPRAAEVLRRSTYVDDVLDSFANVTAAVETAKEVECMLLKGGFRIKCWQLSGDASVSSDPTNADVMLLKSDGLSTRVLGIAWVPSDDVIIFKVVLNFSPKRKGERTGPDLKISDIPRAVPPALSRRIVLQQVMMLFDPLGLICPFTLLAKIYLRETWSINLGWDDPLPDEMRVKWLQFFKQLFHLEDLHFGRALQPPDAVSKPSLILFSDGSDKAYGFAAYIRWQLDDGRFWCKLVMAKSRIAPMRKISTPQMELNAAVLSKRGRKVLEKELRFDFEKILHIVDSETVLNMLHKTSTRFKIYEGVRVGEIQNATGGDMSSWAWLPGEHNSADLLSRGCLPDRLSPQSEWYLGPQILYQPMSQWNLKFGLQRDEILPGEKKVAGCFVSVADPECRLSLCVDFSRSGNFRKITRIVAMLMEIARRKSFKAAALDISPALLRSAEKSILKDVQLDMTDQLSSKHGRYAALSPAMGNDGLWVVGSRLSRFNPMTPESEAQVLLPSNHVITRLLMTQAHESSGHRGRDATLCRFRSRYWTPHGSKLAWTAKTSCQMCKLRDPQLISQQMGPLPESRLKPSPAFTNTMVDLFGPYTVKGEVNKRSSGKAYGVIFTDMVMRAVHIEGVFGYDTNAFMMALSRFASVRGWPAKLYSDPGSQLIGAGRELREAWSNIDRSVLIRKCSDNGLEWIFGPADSPWYQGAVESLVKATKRCIGFAINKQKLSPCEFLTLCSEVANLMNERPIGTVPGLDAEISILTPNCLLVGRATAKNPGSWDPSASSLCARFHFVQSLVDSFWKRWIELCAPALVIQRKWRIAHRNLKPGDVVIISDKNALRGEYRIGIVKDVFPGMDGRVRKVSVMYKSFKIQDRLCKATETVVIRSVHRLALLVPVDEN